MTELMDAARLQQVAHITDQPGRVVRSMIPVLRWMIDEKTGRPVADWVIGEKQGWSAFR